MTQLSDLWMHPEVLLGGCTRTTFLLHYLSLCVCVCVCSNQYWSCTTMWVSQLCYCSAPRTAVHSLIQKHREINNKEKHKACSLSLALSRSLLEVRGHGQQQVTWSCQGLSMLPVTWQPIEHVVLWFTPKQRVNKRTFQWGNGPGTMKRDYGVCVAILMYKKD